MNNAYQVHLRRILGGESPMNVWRKTFAPWPNTMRDAWSELRFAAAMDRAWIAGDEWPIGTVVNIRKPVRYAR